MSDILKIAVVGSGGVAEAFARNISRSKALYLVGIIARNEERGRVVAELGKTTWYSCAEECAEADIYVIAVSDSAVESVAHGLRIPEEAILTHTAGSVPLSTLPERGGRRGIIYPLQTFTQGRDIDLGGVTLFLEADSEPTLNKIRALATALSRNVEYADSERRRTIHLAGVFVNNFTNHLYALGREIVAEEGLDFEVLRPLIAETTAKALDSGNPAAVQTGPARRGDREVIERHIAMLGKDDIKGKIYNDITDSIWETSKRI